MKTFVPKKIVSAACFVIAVAVGLSSAQTPENASTKRVNFGYSQNPKTKAKKETENQSAPIETTNISETPKVVKTDAPKETIAKKTLEVVKKANKNALAPTDFYKIGVGDILFINLQNSSKGSTYFTVLNDGTIDYPLAGEMVSVLGLTTDEIEEILTEKIKLYENPQVSVKVRDYASHKITVLGLVEKSGEKYIQREAVPLFVVRAEAVVQPTATRVVIRRAESSETINLKDENAEATLIFPGDIVEFAPEDSQPAMNNRVGFYFVGGGVVYGGQKQFYDGMTLTQAILAAGGLRNNGVKKVVVRRKNEAGLLASTEYNLKLIKDGKIPDPVLHAGDTIEVGN